MTTFLCTALFGQRKAAYKIYNKKGKEVCYKRIIRYAQKHDIVLFGELHNNPIAHWLQLELTKDLHQKKDLVLGAEMIEQDNQEVLNQYLKEEIDQASYEKNTRLWGNYKTDYAPLIEYAKDNKLPFIATNIPRRYASRVFKQGGFDALNSLDSLEKSWIAPLPIPYNANLPQYKNMLEMMGDHASPDIVKAQAIKDATMAHFILQHRKDDAIFLHYNGAYHSDFHEGILWYIQQENKDLKCLTISTVEQENVHKLHEENKGRADFIICVDEDMTKTY